MMMKRYLILALATCGGVGFFPWASGTLASLVAMGPYYLLQPHPLAYAVTTVAVILVGLAVSGIAEDVLQQKDPHPVVIDEVAGYLIAAAYLPAHWIYPVAAFFLFRLFDVWKPSLIGRSQNLPRGWGIMMDDILAGLLTNLILQALRWLLPF